MTPRRPWRRQGSRCPCRAEAPSPSLKVSSRGASAVTTVQIPLLVLAAKSGRQELVLPALPITVARASGDVTTMCTEPHRIVVDEPIVNEINLSLLPVLVVNLGGDVPERALLKLARDLQDKIEALPAILEAKIGGA